jgi:hypothetical protein
MKDIPGFNADVSLHKTREFYDFRAVWVDGADRQKVVQQIEFDPGEVVVPFPSYYECRESLWGPGPGGALYCITCCYWGPIHDVYCSLPYRCS